MTNKKWILWTGIGAAVLMAAFAVYYFILRVDLTNKIVIPYIAHQKPLIDPHIPSSVPEADKLDEVLFDGLFNVSANSSGITYEDGLGELVEIAADNVVTIRLRPDKKWHNSYKVEYRDKEVQVSAAENRLFSDQDLRFTLRRIQRLGSLSPDYVLVAQAIDQFDFIGPDANNEIRFKFRDDRIWTEDDVKEVLSFKILPFDSEIFADQYLTGTGPYMAYAGENAEIGYYHNPEAQAEIKQVVLQPFIDNSTYSTELKNGNINTLLATPFGSLAPILENQEKFFYKSNISTTYFALLFNVQRLNTDQRKALRAGINNYQVLERFYKLNSPQQRHIADYKGNQDNYNDYLNFSIFPGSSYYIEDEVLEPLRTRQNADWSILPDSISIVTNLNYGLREELTELVEIFNDPAISQGKLHAITVPDEEIRAGNYDALLIAVSGYRSNFLFDVYDLFLREPSFEYYKIHLQTDSDGYGNRTVNPQSFKADKNFFRLDLSQTGPEEQQYTDFLHNLYGFMSAQYLGDKQEYARRIDFADQDLAFGSWLFSLPSLVYFSTQFEAGSIDLYGVASQLSTIEKWREKPEE